mmetsp:Transcript_12276/g.24689  ORF Transcript_12276/g.24689 Transcript_12276/m.24689 type:complete len:247 (+) Transcript_12276:1586-2326(+)
MSVFMDIAVGDASLQKSQEEAYSRTCDYLQEIHTQFGWSARLSELSTDDKEMLTEIYESDPRWQESKGPCRVEEPDAVRTCRFKIDLFEKEAPKASANFKALCQGNQGKGKTSGKPLHYKGIRFHRFVKDFCLQGGDIVKNDGSGGDSIYGGAFKDDKEALKKLSHNTIGIVSYANSGANTNKSQFFFVLDGKNASTMCDRKHVIVGKVVNEDAIDFLKHMNDSLGVVEGIEEPNTDVYVADCGLL